MTRTQQGTLIIIGGHEDKADNKVILSEVARRLGAGKLVVTTVASKDPAGLFEDYERAFRSLGVQHIFRLDVASRAEARSPARQRILDDASAVFFTGGDQLKITSQIGDTPIFQRIHEIFDQGGIIAGTSAGASVMCENMLVSGDSDESARVGDIVQMAPGLGLITGLIVDQHFAQRGRMGRLTGAVAQNPRSIGVGIDEDTAIVVERLRNFYVLGSGAVYVLDGSTVTDSNIAEEEAEKCLSIYDLRLHVLSEGDSYDLHDRRPGKLTGKRADKLPDHTLESASADE